MVKTETVQKLFNEFLSKYNPTKMNEIWKKQSNEFRIFWKNKIMDTKSSYSDVELEKIIQILDVEGKRSAKDDTVGTAFVQIYQGDWVKIFAGIKIIHL